MAIFNFEGKKRKHEIEMANLSHALRMREIQAELGYRASEGEAERGTRRELTYAEIDSRKSEGKEGRGLQRELSKAEIQARKDEGKANRGFQRGMQKDAQNHAIKAIKVNSIFGSKTYERNRRVDATIADEANTLQRMKLRRSLELAGSPDADRELANMDVATGRAVAADADFRREGYKGRDAAAEGQAESGAKIWGAKASAYGDMARVEYNQAVLPYMAEKGRKEFEADIEKMNALKDLYRTNPEATLGGSAYGAVNRPVSGRGGKRPVVGTRQGDVPVPESMKID